MGSVVGSVLPLGRLWIRHLYVRGRVESRGKKIRSIVEISPLLMHHLIQVLSTPPVFPPHSPVYQVKLPIVDL